MEYIEIGKIKKPHGLNGELKGTIDERFWGDVAKVDAFFVEQRGEKAPFFIEDLRGTETLILKFEDIDTKEDASLLTNKRLYLRRQDISLSEEEINDTGLEYSFLEGYTLKEEEAGRVGTIKYVDEYPQQEMATVDTGTKEILIPLRAAWIIEVDKNEKLVTMSLPEGLLDI